MNILASDTQIFRGGGLWGLPMGSEPPPPDKFLNTLTPLLGLFEQNLEFLLFCNNFQISSKEHNLEQKNI